MTNKNNKIKIVGKMGSAIGKDLSHLVGNGLKGICDLGSRTIIATGYIASLPLVGSLNNSANRRILTKLEEKAIEEDKFLNKMHGSQMASIANVASILAMPILYGLATYQQRPDKYGFIGGFTLGAIESVGRIFLRSELRTDGQKFYPGTIVGAILGIAGEKSYDYLRNKYEEIKMEEVKK